MAAPLSISVRMTLPSGNAPLPSLSAAVRDVAERTHAQWVAYAQGEPLPSGKKVSDRTGRYAASIKLRQTGDLAAEVYSDERVAEQIESGVPARDLKEMLRTSRKTRLNARGGKYLVIPFRWSQPGGQGAHGGQMPISVANWWRYQPASKVAGWAERTSATGDIVPQRLYHWGASLQLADMDRLGIRGTGARKLMRGMVSFRPQSARSAGGASKGGAMTFRTMSESSSGWITRPKPGLGVARQVAEQVRPEAEKAFKAALEADLARLFGKG